MRATLYLQDQANIITGVQVREAEDCRGATTNWAAHFAKKFHENMVTSKSVKKTRLGSHIRVILSMHKWITEEQSEAPPGFPNVVAAPPSIPRVIHIVGVRSSPAPVTQATSSRRRRKLSTKTNPSPIPKITQARDLTPKPMPIPNVVTEDMPMPSEEPVASEPQFNTEEATPPEVQNLSTDNEVEPSSPKVKKRKHASRATSTSSREANTTDVPQPLESYPPYFQPVILAHMTQGENSALEVMSQISSKDFMDSFHKQLHNPVYDYSRDLLKWTRSTSIEVLNLWKLLAELKAKL
ncbi:unnamed protein product [Calypogeia fissa]